MYINNVHMFNIYIQYTVINLICQEHNYNLIIVYFIKRRYVNIPV